MKDRMKQKKLVSKIRKSKQCYDAIETPEELEDVVERAVRCAGRAGIRHESHEAEPAGREKLREAAGEKTARGFGGHEHGRYFGKAAAVTAAAVLICFTAGLNTSPAFAAAMEDVPVLGAVSRVLTFRTYDHQDQDKTIHMEIPNVQTGGAGGQELELEQRLNEEIEESMNRYRQDAEQRIAEYKEAFLATGGTESEFAEKGIRVDAGYEVFCENETTLSFAIHADENWCGAYDLYTYYNIDLQTGEPIALSDLLGSEYAETANAAVREQMSERMKTDPNLVYWDGSNGIEGFTSVNENTGFYINQAGNPVIVFDKYEIAPGAFGRQEFEIPR